MAVMASALRRLASALLRELFEAHTAADAAATMVTAVLDDPRGYGRIVRDSDGAFLRVVETKVAADANEAARASSEPGRS